MENHLISCKLIGIILLLTGCVASSPIQPTSSLPTTPNPLQITANPSIVSAAFPDPLREEFKTDANSLPQATRYMINLKIDPVASTVKGSETIQYTNTESVPLPDFYLRLLPNTPSMGGKMTVSDLTMNGSPIVAESRLDNSAIWFPLDPPLLPGKAISIQLNFEITIPVDQAVGYGELANNDGIISLANSFAFVPVYNDEGWNVELAPTYGDPLFSDIAFFQVTIQTDSKEILATSGSCDSPNPGTWNCAMGPARTFTTVLSPDFVFENKEVSGTNICSTFLPDDRSGGLDALKTAEEALKIYEDMIGKYPFREIDIVETPNLASGIEYPGLVVLANRIYTDQEIIEWVTAHEVAHQWWYNLVGNDQLEHPWLDESLTQYTTLLYFEKRYGISLSNQLRNQIFQIRYEMIRGTSDDLPIGMPVQKYTEKQYSPVIYYKGPLYFDALRQRVGDENFFKIIREYFKIHRYGIATPESFLKVVNTISGSYQEDLYQKWFVGN